MVIEASRTLKLPVLAGDSPLGTTTSIIFEAKTAKVFGWQVKTAQGARQLAGLNFAELEGLDSAGLYLANSEGLTSTDQALKEMLKLSGPLLEVQAVTETGTKLGKVIDVVFDTTSGLITRYYVANLWHEQIVPSELLVSIEPERVIFKDEVAKPKNTRVAEPLISRA